MTYRHTARAEDEVPCHWCKTGPQPFIGPLPCPVCGGCGVVPRMVDCPEHQHTRASFQHPDSCRCKGTGKVPAAEAVIEVCSREGRGLQWLWMLDVPDSTGWSTVDYDTHDEALEAARKAGRIIMEVSNAVY